MSRNAIDEIIDLNLDENHVEGLSNQMQTELINKFSPEEIKFIQWPEKKLLEWYYALELIKENIDEALDSTMRAKAMERLEKKYKVTKAKK